MASDTPADEALQPRWFWAAAVYKAVDTDKPRKRHLWHKVVFVLQASDADNAKVKADRIAQRKQHRYPSATGANVSWVLQEVEAIQELFDEPIRDGTEVYWQFTERVDKTAS